MTKEENEESNCLSWQSVLKGIRRNGADMIFPGN
jgi:hypothetical protein